MGVMMCNRMGCETILCNRYSDEFGYICYECFEELEESGKRIRIFMQDRKGATSEYNYNYEFKKLNHDAPQEDKE